MLERPGARQREQAESRSSSGPETGDQNIGIENDSRLHCGIICDTTTSDKHEFKKIGDRHVPDFKNLEPFDAWKVSNECVSLGWFTRLGFDWRY